jgi:(p)ppGpp synthase/HD superfamily hydrolase
MTSTDAPRRPFNVAAAITLAQRAHDGQLDKAGRPYIQHPLRVMRRVSGESGQMAAVLHDVVEDTEVSLQDLRDAGCPEDVVVAVDALTKRPGETLEASLARVVANPLARVVKLADIADNTDPERTVLLPNDVRARLAEKYRRSLRALGSPPAGTEPTSD